MSNVPNSWAIKKVDDYTEIITDYVANGSFASLKENVEYVDYSDYVLIRLADYNSNFNGEFRYITKNSYDFLSKTKLYGGEIIISNVGANAGTVFKAPILDKKMSLGPNSITLKTFGNDDFYYYWFKSIYGQHALGTIITGSAQPKFNKTNFRDLLIPVPPIEEQDAIVKVIKVFDNKIENNNAIIANLEEQAQTIFKSWFLDSALFQDEDFENKKLGDLFQFIKGKKPKATSDSYEEAYVPYLVKKYIDGNEATFASIDDGILIDDLDVFMLMDGANSGNIYYGYHGILGSTFSLLKNDNEMVNEYIYWYLLINQESVKNQNTGSAIPHANKDYINNLEVILPIDMETNRVLKTLRDIRLYTINLRRESNKLTATRDTLLPKLMSGEIRVEDTIEVKEM